MAKKLLVVILFIAICMTVLCGYGSKTENGWFTNPDISTWFGRGGTDKDPDKSNSDNNNSGEDKPGSDNDTEINGTDGAVISIVESNGIQLLDAKLPRAAYAANGISAQAETAYLLTASISSGNAEDTSVDWLVSWRNSDSAWARGKTVTDYVTVTPKADGALTANAEIRKVFCEQIEITVLSRDKSDVFATCKCDYVKRVISFSAELLSNKIEFSENEHTYETVFNIEYSDGTIAPDLKITDCILVSNINVDTVYGFTPNGSLAMAAYTTCRGVSVENNSFTISTPITAFANKFTIGPYQGANASQMPKCTVDEAVERAKKMFTDSFKKGVTGTETDGVITFNYTVSYMGTEYISESYEIGVAFDISALEV